MNTKSDRHSLRNFFAGSFAAALAVIVSNASAAIPPAEKLLPDDTLIVVGTPDCNALRTFYKTSPQTQLWDDPAMKPFRDKFVSKFQDEFVHPLEHDLGVQAGNFTDLPQGQVTFAITQNGWHGTSDQLPALLILLDAKDKSTQLKTNLSYLQKKWIESGKTSKTQKIRDVEFTSYFLADKDVPRTIRSMLSPNTEAAANDSPTNNSAKTEFLIGQFDSLLVAGTSEQAVESVVAHLTGGSAPALAEVQAFENDRLAIFRDAPFYAWVNAKIFLDLLYHKPAGGDADPANPLAIFTPEKIIGASGLGSLKTLAFAFQNSPDGSLAQFYVNAPEASRQGLLKLFPSDGKESSPPAFVPADAIKFQRARIDGQKAWATLQKIFSELSPQIMTGINFALDTANAAQREKDPSFDIQKNLFGNLGDDIITYEKAPRGNTLADLNSPPSIFLLGSPRAEQLAAAMKSILVLANPQGGPPAEREFLGHKIYSLPLPAVAMAATGKSTPHTLNYAAGGNYVAITTDTSMIEEYLRSSDSQQKPLRETSGLLDAAQKLGGTSVGIFGYQNNLELSRAMFEVLRKNSANGASNPSPLPGMDLPMAGGVFKDWMDFSLLPPFEQIAKYFYFSVYGLSANADGLSFKMFAPVPPQLKK